LERDASKLTMLKNKTLTLQDGGKEGESEKRGLVSTLGFPISPFDRLLLLSGHFEQIEVVASVINIVKVAVDVMTKFIFNKRKNA